MVINHNNYKDQLKLLDIIIVYNKKSLLHRLIRRVTGYKAGHVLIYAGKNKIVEASIGYDFSGILSFEKPYVEVKMRPQSQENIQIMKQLIKELEDI